MEQEKNKLDMLMKKAKIERELARAEEKMPDTAINEETDEGESEEE